MWSLDLVRLRETVVLATRQFHIDIARNLIEDLTVCNGPNPLSTAIIMSLCSLTVPVTQLSMPSKRWNANSRPVNESCVCNRLITGILQDLHLLTARSCLAGSAAIQCPCAG